MNLQLYFLWVSLFFIVITSLLAYPPFIILAYLSFTLVIFWKRNPIIVNKYHFIFILLVSFFLILVSLGWGVGREFLLTINICIAFFLAWLLYCKGGVNGSIFTVKRLILVLIILLVTFSFISNIFFGIEINFIFKGSRNSLSATLLFLFLLYSSFERFPIKKDVLLVLTLLICAIYIESRSFIILSMVLLVYYSFLFLHKRVKVVVASMIVIFVVIVLYQVLNDQIYLQIFQRDDGSYRGLSSRRYQLLIEYLNSLDAEGIFFGGQLSGRFWIEKYMGNPHNSLVLGHHILGIFYIFLLFSIVIFSLLYGTFHTNFLILIFIIRVSLDLLSLPGVFDLLFFIIFFNGILHSNTYNNKFTNSVKRMTDT
jgi:hypothetical protein